MRNQNQVPKWPHRFFRWYCRPDRYEELHGDLEELFHQRIDSNGLYSARLLYVWDVICCCQPYALKNQNHYKGVNMISNYIKISTRVICKNPLSSGINIAGLSAAIGICVLVFAFAQWTLTKDEFHQNCQSVYLVTHIANIAGKTEQVGSSPRPLGELLKNDFPEIEKMCRMEQQPTVVKYGDQVFRERLHAVDPSYLEMFTFPLKWGDAASLRDLNSIVLSEETATKYFGVQNPVGVELELLFNEAKSKLYKVAGVAAKFPEARSFDFQLLVNFKNLEWINPTRIGDDWTKNVSATYVQINSQADAQRIEYGMDKYKELKNRADDQWQIQSFTLEPLATLYRKSSTMRESPVATGYSSNVKAIFFLSFIATFMLALACFNYINIAIVSSAKRLKEIGVRKSIGATNRKVVTQFLIENGLFTLFALVFGASLGKFVIIPWFQDINSFRMDFTVLDINLWLFLVGVLLVTTLVAGLYPAVFISRFQTANIFKGAVHYGKQNPLTKILLGFQLVLASVLIVSAVMFTLNSSYLAKQSWGYEPGGVLYSVVQDGQGFERLRDKFQQNPKVQAIGGAALHIGTGHKSTIVERPDKNYEVQAFGVGAGYLEMLNLKVINGRSFNTQKDGDRQSVIINETMANVLGLNEPIGELIIMDGISYQVVGVVRDFRAYDFDTPIEPTLFLKSNEEEFRFFVVKIQAGQEVQAYRELQQTWASLFPETPFQGGFQEDVWGPFFHTMETHGSFWRGIAGIAMLLAGLGLYGLVAMNVSGRIKEFSIRKVLGADTSSILISVLKNYVWLYAISLALGAPLSYMAVKQMLDVAYEYHVPMNFSSLLLASILLILALLLVVVVQVRKIQTQSPAGNLKTE